MKLFFSSLTFFVFFSLQTFSQSIRDNEDMKTLKKMEYDWLIAEFKLDTATISKMMDDGFISIGASSISTKQEELNGIYQNISERMKNNHVVDSLYLDDVNIKIHDNTAIVTFISVTKGRIKDVPFANRRTRFYDVWVKKGGAWKAVSSQGIPIK